MKGTIHKFNPQSSWTEQDAKRTDAYALMCKLERGEKPKMNELEWLFSEHWHHNSYRYGYVMVMGWMFDFKPYLRRFLVNDKACGWREILAYNKTAIRKCAANPSYILEIVELPVKRR